MIRLKLAVADGRRLSTAADLTVDRIRQLRAAGHSARVLSDATGIHPNYILELSTGNVERLQLKTFHAIEKVYRELRDFPGGDKRAAGYALRRGWRPPPPLPVPDRVEESVVDEVAVRRALNGERVPLTRAEITDAWARLEATGMSATAIGERLHTAPRTVQRWRSAGPATTERAG